MMSILRRLSRHLTLRLSAVLTLLGLGFMVWSLLEPTPMPVMLAMTMGQALGTAAFAIYAVIVIREIRREVQRGRSRDPS
jgi:membrane protein implicated in regulation of membrane protease activity